MQYKKYNKISITKKKVSMKIVAISARTVHNAIVYDLVLDDGVHFTGQLLVRNEDITGDIAPLISGINDVLAPYLVGREPHIIEMDALLLNGDITSLLSMPLLYPLSHLIVQAHAYQEQLPLYEFIAHLCDIEQLSLPMQMYTVVRSTDGLSPEIMLTSVGMQTCQESMNSIVQCRHEVEQQLSIHAIPFTTKNGEIGVEQALAVEQILALTTTALQKSVLHNSVLLSLDMTKPYYDIHQKCYLIDNNAMPAHELIDWYVTLINRFSLYSLHNPLSIRDWQGWQHLKNIVGTITHLVTNDLFNQEASYIWQQDDEHNGISAVINPATIGTVTQTLQAIKLCNEYDIPIILSNNNYDMNDGIIIDFAVGAGAVAIKLANASLDDCTYNRLITIEQDLLLG